jgi:hypothetical protein
MAPDFNPLRCAAVGEHKNFDIAQQRLAPIGALLIFAKRGELETDLANLIRGFRVAAPTRTPPLRWPCSTP